MRFILAVLLFLLCMSPTPAQDITVMEKAKKLCFDGDYEASDKLLEGYKGDQDNIYHLVKMLNAFQQNNKSTAEKHLKVLEDTFVPLPRRYESLVWIIRGDIDHWKSEDLGDIARDMKNSGGRLAVARSGDKTQEVQKEIVRKLDKQIKDLEDKASGAASKGDKDKDAQAKAKSQGQGKPADESNIMGGDGKGIIDEKRLKQIAENWGTLPPAKRQAIIQELTRDLPAKYKPMIEEYYKALARSESYKK